MGSKTESVGHRIWQTASSIRTGIILLILVGVASAAGTLILQRPLTEPEKLARAYSPETLRWLDALGLTDVFHSWWFAMLLGLFCLTLIFASVERFPSAWRFFSRPYRRPEPHFLAGLPLHQEIEVREVPSSVDAAERAFRRLGLKPQRLGKGTDASLYAERNRISRLAAYVVHASLLLIFGGALVDAIYGYRGFVALTQDEQINQIELRDGTKKALPFAVRCDGAGQEDYPDGTPKRWWSKLAVIEGGREVKRKEIEVNEPLVYRGLRFFQSSYGATGQVGSIRLTAAPKSDPNRAREILLRPGESVPLDAETSVHLKAFVPDFVIRGSEIDTRSDQPNNPAIQLAVDSKKSGEVELWVFPRFPQFAHPDKSLYAFRFVDLQMAYFTGLQVSYEPGQWAVWAGCILMGVGLTLAFYFIHMRFWVVPVSDGRGRQALWVGASASKNREDFEDRFRRLVEEIERELKAVAEESDPEPAATLVGT